MSFDDLLAQVLALLQSQGRVSYRALKIRCNCDDTYIEAIKDELIYARQLAVDEDNRVLVWTGPAAISLLTRPTDTVGTTPVSSAATNLSPLSAHVTGLGGERRHVTIVFADISGFTALAEHNDPEDIRNLMNACFTHLVPIVERYGGTIDKFIGDEIMALFGAPIAHDNDAERAVYAALEMMDALAIFNTERGTTLGLHCGINTGMVIAGNLGTESRQEYSVMGDAVNLASRLEDASERGDIFVGPETYRLTQGTFVFEAPKLMMLKGKAEPVPVYRVVGPRHEQHGFERSDSTAMTPFIGRDAELSLLLDYWESARQGMGYVILLSGEAGIGKSRLTRRFRDQIKSGLHVHFECRCSPYHQQSPFYPFIDLLQNLLQWEPNQPGTSKLAQLEQILASYALSLEETIPSLADLLSLVLPEDRYPPTRLSPQEHRQRTMEALMAILRALVAREPVLFVIEDMHWADPSTSVYT